MTQISSDAAARLAARAAAVIPGGVNSGQRRVPGLEDLVVTATSGSTFTDADGRVYTDYHAAFGPPLLGHNDPDVDGAVAGAAGLMGVGVTPVEIELAERLVDAVPSLEKVLLTATGSEATFHALRLARTVTGRRHVIKFQGCYHGWHDSVAMNVISPAERVGGKDPLSQGILPEVLDATIVCRFNDADAVEQALSDHDVAAIILEPIPHNIGAVLPKPGFLEQLRELATKHGTVLVFDEVITGFRHGLGGYQAIAGVTPDLTTLGKAMANGWPVSALGGKAELMDLFSTTPGSRRSSPARSTVIRPRPRRRSRRWTSSSASPSTSTSSGSVSAPARGCVRFTRASASRSSWPASARSSSPTSSRGRWRATTTCSGTTSTSSSATGAS